MLFRSPGWAAEAADCGLPRQGATRPPHRPAGAERSLPLGAGRCHPRQPPAGRRRPSRRRRIRPGPAAGRPAPGSTPAPGPARGVRGTTGAAVRGGRVAHRLALDFPTRIKRLAVLDIIPTLHMFENVDREMAQSYFHWFFLIQGNGVPERLINADPQAWIASRFSGRLLGENPIDPETITEYTNIFRDPAHVAATCADYRAAASIDLDHDRADRSAKHRITAPLLVMWGQSSYVGRNFDSVAVWGNFADQVTGIQAPSDHYIPEEAPSFTAEVLSEFFSAGFNK